MGWEKSLDRWLMQSDDEAYGGRGESAVCTDPICVKAKGYCGLCPRSSCIWDMGESFKNE